MNRIRRLWWGMVVVVVGILAWMVMSWFTDVSRQIFGLLAIMGLALVLLGGWLLIEVRRQQIRGRLRKWLLIAGWSGLGIPVSMVLHNVVYGLGILILGEGVWGKGDEGVFFVLGLVVFPILLIVGLVGSGVEMRRQS